MNQQSGKYIHVILAGCLVMTLFLIASCHTSPSSEDKTLSKPDSVVAESIRTNLSYLNDFNALEQVFGNENWLLADKKDSNYLYFSRLGNYTFNTYAYKLVKGDSANVVFNSIVPDHNNLAWNFDGQPLVIASATGARIVWVVRGKDSLRYAFTRLDNHSISVVYPDKRTVILKKTLPLSLFLVRSRYDYAHKTHLAFDTTQFNKKRS